MAAPSPEEKSIIYNGLRLYLHCKPNKTGSLTPNNCDMKAPITVCFTLAFLAELQKAKEEPRLAKPTWHKV